MTPLQKARQVAANRYPISAGMNPSTGQPLPNIPREAILRGDWDSGRLVQDALATLDK